MNLSPDAVEPTIGKPGPGTTKGAFLGGFTILEARQLVRDLQPHRMGVYWFDLIVSLAFGYGAFMLFPYEQPVSLRAGVAFTICVFALYRAAMFIHEIAHMSAGTHKAFRWMWNAFCGIPLLIPSFMYDMHGEHHARRTYGTDLDGEYLAFASAPRFAVLGLPLVAPLAPIALVLRFVVLSPLSWLVPRLRGWVLAQASALVVDGGYRRQASSPEQTRSYVIQEAACLVYCCAVGILVSRGVVEVTHLVVAAAVVAAIVFVNFLRLLGAHSYRGNGETLSFEEQVLDSVDYPHSRFLGALWAPLGTRYHAVHHLFPTLPYHSLRAAHRRLAAALPVDSLYRATSRASLVASVVQLLQRTSGSAKAGRIGLGAP